MVPPVIADNECIIKQCIKMTGQKQISLISLKLYLLLRDPLLMLSFLCWLDEGTRVCLKYLGINEKVVCTAYSFKKKKLQKNYFL